MLCSMDKHKKKNTKNLAFSKCSLLNFKYICSIFYVEYMTLLLNIPLSLNLFKVYDYFLKIDFKLRGTQFFEPDMFLDSNLFQTL